MILQNAVYVFSSIHFPHYFSLNTKKLKLADNNYFPERQDVIYDMFYFPKIRCEPLLSPFP